MKVSRKISTKETKRESQRVNFYWKDCNMFTNTNWKMLAHCVSQWAHNFRPCFLRFQSILSLMNPQSILAITATAGPRVIEDICQTIGIESSKHPEGNRSLGTGGIKVIERGRDNIDVACQFLSSQEERLLMVSVFFLRYFSLSTSLSKFFLF